MNKKYILFDDKCSLCNYLIKIIKTKLKNDINFIPIDCDESKKLIKKFNIQHEDSIVFIRNNNFFLRSKAIIQISSMMPLPYKMLRILSIFPAFILDFLYSIIAKIRPKKNQKNKCCSNIS